MAKGGMNGVAYNTDKYHPHLGEEDWADRRRYTCRIVGQAMGHGLAPCLGMGGPVCEVGGELDATERLRERVRE